MIYVMPSRSDLKPLEDIFQATILKMLKEEGRINDDIITNLLSWRHSGFSVDNSVRIAADNQDGKITLAQYIIRNTFSVDKLTYNEQSGMVIYNSKMTHGKEKKIFEVYTAEEFIAAVTQHIPSKSFQRKCVCFYPNLAKKFAFVSQYQFLDKFFSNFFNP